MGILSVVVYVSLAGAVFAVARRLIYGFSDRTLRDVVPFIRRVVIEDLQNLLHPDVEDHIRVTNSARTFRSTQRKRICLTLQYLEDLGQTASICQAWAHYERKLSIRFPDADRKRASIQLIQACLQSRTCIWRMKITLHWWLIKMAFCPFLTPPTVKDLLKRGSFDLFVFYEQMKQAAG